jgi:ParB family chromosome partitioning protein
VALGKGLGEILEEVGRAYEYDLDDGAQEHTDNVRSIPLDAIDPNPYQPRKHFDPERLAELSESIVRHGLLQPVVVIAHGDRYVLVAGERRWRAHALAGLETIRAVVADVDMDELRLRELALVENIQRENLNPIELARSYQELIDVHRITHEGLAQIVHKSRSQITNTLRLLTLPEYVQELLVQGKLTQGHAKLLAGLPSEKIRIVVDTVIGQKLSVRETEKLLKQPAPTRKTSSQASRYAPETIERLRAVLPFSHTLRKGKLEILLPNEDDLIKFITLLEKK